jgi:hypothetical protein
LPVSEPQQQQPAQQEQQPWVPGCSGPSSTGAPEGALADPAAIPSWRNSPRAGKQRQRTARFARPSLNGRLSSNLVVQYSTNLAGSNWMNLLSLSNLPASPYLFLDQAGDGEPAKATQKRR